MFFFFAEKTCFSFAFCSLIRTFAPNLEINALITG